MILGDNEQVVCSCDLTYVKMAIIFFLCMQIPDMLSSRGSHACAVLDDKLYAIGGYAALKPLVCKRSDVSSGTMLKRQPKWLALQHISCCMPT